MQLVQEAIKEAIAATFGAKPVVSLPPPSDHAPAVEPKPKRQRNGKGKGANATPAVSSGQAEPPPSNSKGSQVKTGRGARVVMLHEQAGGPQGEGKGGLGKAGRNDRTAKRQEPEPAANPSRTEDAPAAHKG